MNAKYLVVAGLLCFAASAFAAAPAPADRALEKDRATIKATIAASFPELKIDAIEPVSWSKDWYEIVTGGQIAYTNRDGSLLFSGKVIETKSKEDLTTKRWNEVNKIDFAALPFEKAIKTTRGDGSRKLAVFADPLCPFCVKLESELKHVDNVTIYTFLLPLENLHAGATAISRMIWCSKDPAQAWDSWMASKAQPEAQSCDGDVVVPLQALSQKLGINSTPTIVFADGIRNPGFMEAKEITQALAKSN